MLKPNYGRGMAARNGELLCNGKLDRGVAIVARDCIFALITERGSLPADPEKGLGLLSIVFDATDTASLPAIAPDIESEFAKDPRIDSTDATVEIVNGVLVINAVVTMRSGPTFALIGPISDVRTEILSS